MTSDLSKVRHAIESYKNHHHPEVSKYFRENHQNLVDQFEQGKQQILAGIAPKNPAPHEICAVLADHERACIRHLQSIERQCALKSL